MDKKCKVNATKEAKKKKAIKMELDKKIARKQKATAKRLEKKNRLTSKMFKIFSFGLTAQALTYMFAEWSAANIYLVAGINIIIICIGMSIVEIKYGS